MEEVKYLELQKQIQDLKNVVLENQKNIVRMNEENLENKKNMIRMNEEIVYLRKERQRHERVFHLRYYVVDEINTVPNIQQQNENGEDEFVCSPNDKIEFIIRMSCNEGNFRDVMEKIDFSSMKVSLNGKNVKNKDVTKNQPKEIRFFARFRTLGKSEIFVEFQNFRRTIPVVVAEKDEVVLTVEKSFVSKVPANSFRRILYFEKQNKIVSIDNKKHSIIHKLRVWNVDTGKCKTVGSIRCSMFQHLIKWNDTDFIVGTMNEIQTQKILLRYSVEKLKKKKVIAVKDYENIVGIMKLTEDLLLFISQEKFNIFSFKRGGVVRVLESSGGFRSLVPSEKFGNSFYGNKTKPPSAVMIDYKKDVVSKVFKGKFSPVCTFFSDLDRKKTEILVCEEFGLGRSSSIIYFFNTDTEQCFKKLTLSDSMIPVTCFRVFSYSNSQLLCVGGGNNTSIGRIVLFDLKNNYRILEESKVHTNTVCDMVAMSYSASKKNHQSYELKFITCSDDKSIKIMKFRLKKAKRKKDLRKTRKKHQTEREVKGGRAPLEEEEEEDEGADDNMMIPNRMLPPMIDQNNTNRIQNNNNTQHVMNMKDENL